MTNKKLLCTGATGTVITAICCFTPVLAVLLGALGLSAWLGWIDYVLFPALAAFLGITVYAAHHRQADVEGRRQGRGRVMSGAGNDRRSASDNGNGETFDLAVIGAGSAGFSAAIHGAQLGARVALIGHGTIGGTCVNTGCVPSKALIRAAEALHQGEAASRFAGIRGGTSLADWGATVAQKDALVADMRQSKYRDLLPAYNGIAYMEGPAQFADGGVTVNGALLRPKKIVLATGSSPAAPPIPGIEDVPYLTSTTAMALKRLPKSLLVLGGGYIGCELAQMFARAGVKVSILCRSRLLPEAEPEIGAALTGYFGDEGISVLTGVTYEAVRGEGVGVTLSLSVDGVGREIEAEQILIATGRRPNTGGLGLEQAGVELTPEGGVKVDDRMRTTKSGVYAAGDVTGRDMHVYMAAYGAKIAAENALNGDGRRYDRAAMPAVVFTDPQGASVGLTEAKARAQGLDVRTTVLPLDQVPRALVARDTRGLIKLVAERASGRLLGAHILAPEGGECIQTAALAIKHGMTARDLAETIFPYLTTVEGLKLAALSFEQDVTKLSCCAG
jgi:mercury(II) reductase